MTPTRRDFLHSAAAFGAMCVAGRSLLADQAAASDPLGGLKLGMQSYSFRSMSLEKAAAEMHNIGLGRMEIFPNHMAGMSPRQVLDKLETHNVKLVSYGVPGFTKNDDENRKIFDLAKKLEIKNISCNPDPDAFDSLDKLTEEYGITAAIHPHGPTDRWGKIDTIQQAIKDHSKMIGVCNDTGHLIRAGEDPLKACELFKDRMPAMHLKSFKTQKGGHIVLGEGLLDLDGVVKWLLDNNYKGEVLIEYEGKDEVETVRKSVEAVKASVAKARKA